jgi:hypothetical protein
LVKKRPHVITEIDKHNMKNANNREEKVSFSLAKKRMVAVRKPIMVVTKTKEKKMSTVGCMQFNYHWLQSRTIPIKVKIGFSDLLQNNQADL